MSEFDALVAQLVDFRACRRRPTEEQPEPIRKALSPSVQRPEKRTWVTPFSRPASPLRGPSPAERRAELKADLQRRVATANQLLKSWVGTGRISSLDTARLSVRIHQLANLEASL